LKKIKLGLCRVTFRKSDPLSILKICKKSGIEGIEWGGDIHSPIGDITQAK
jgi:3-dehydroshikimate dehydratase